MAVTPDGTRAVTGSDDRTVRVWDLATGTQVASFTAEDWVLAVAAGPTRCLFVAGDNAGRVHILNLESVDSA